MFQNLNKTSVKVEFFFKIKLFTEKQNSRKTLIYTVNLGKVCSGFLLWICIKNKIK